MKQFYLTKLGITNASNDEKMKACCHHQLANLSFYIAHNNEEKLAELALEESALLTLELTDDVKRKLATCLKCYAIFLCLNNENCFQTSYSQQAEMWVARAITYLENLTQPVMLDYYQIIECAEFQGSLLESATQTVYDSGETTRAHKLEEKALGAFKKGSLEFEKISKLVVIAVNLLSIAPMEKLEYLLNN